MKQLSSSTPNALHDLLPKVEQMQSDLADLPNLNQKELATLEENINQNLVAVVKTEHEGTWAKLAEKFETMDHR